VATVVSGNIHIVGAGTSTITASQAGDEDYNLAPNVAQTLTVVVGGIGGTYTLNPIHDAYVRDNNTQDGTGPDLITKNATATWIRESYIMFDLSSLNSATLATLRLYCNVDEGGNSELFKVSNDTWTETGITWANKPAPGTLIGSLPGNIGYMEWNVTSYVNDELSNGKASFCLKATDNALINFNSKEASTNKPELVIDGMLKSIILDEGQNEQVNLDNNLKVYPNPLTRNQLTIELATNEASQLTITNFVGQVVYSRQIKGERVINISKNECFEKGMYIICLQSNGFKQATKLIVQ
jgi:hypothetical protein